MKKIYILIGIAVCSLTACNQLLDELPGNQVRIGSNSVLVAPVTIGDKATTGAGSVITKNCAAGKLVIARARQQTVEGWVRPEKPAKS